jgi:SAM-dependent methyltransferase
MTRQSAVFPLLTIASLAQQALCMASRFGQPDELSASVVQAPHSFDAHPARGRFNSAFFWLMGDYINWHMRKRKANVFADLPSTVVEIGPGVGANLRYLSAESRLIAVEPNPYMHTRLRRAARAAGVDLQIRDIVAERIDLPDASVDAVISSLVLCSVRDPDLVLAEIRRILRPGGRFSFTEHVAARRGTPTRWTQRLLRRPWAWLFEGCSCERDLEKAIEGAGFTFVALDHYRIHSPFLPFNTHIAGTVAA